MVANIFLGIQQVKQQRSSNQGTNFFSIRCITHFGILILISIIIDCIVCGCVCYITVGDVLDDQYRIMFMDVAGPEKQMIGSAVSNSLGYLAAALTTYVAATVITQQAFVWVGVCSMLGLVISCGFIQDTREFVVLEKRDLY